MNLAFIQSREQKNFYIKLSTLIKTARTDTSNKLNFFTASPVTNF